LYLFHGVSRFWWSISSCASLEIMAHLNRSQTAQAERNVLPVLNNLLENREMQLVNCHLFRNFFPKCSIYIYSFLNVDGDLSIWGKDVVYSYHSFILTSKHPCKTGQSLHNHQKNRDFEGGTSWKNQHKSWGQLIHGIARPPRDRKVILHYLSGIWIWCVFHCFSVFLGITIDPIDINSYKQL